VEEVSTQELAKRIKQAIEQRRHKARRGWEWHCVVGHSWEKIKSEVRRHKGRFVFRYQG